MKFMMKRLVWCAALGSAVVYAGLTVVPVMVMGGCGNNDAIIYCNPRKDAGAKDGGEGGAGGVDPAACP